MSKKGYTHIGLALDKSGSMDTIRDVTISRFNEFLKEQQDAPGEATLSMVQFSSAVEFTNQFQSIKTIQPLTRDTFNPNGMTALNDAIGELIDTTGKRLAALPEEERPAGVLMVIITDGGENSSKRYGLSKIKEMIQHQTDKYQWEFIYLGANVDEQEEGKTRGFSTSNSIGFTASTKGVTDMYDSLSIMTKLYRSKH